ncbi:hypothetical protein BC832DRAFT_593144 [Gaertneriomyces semiglobifer]|nr:hypothetical protein BC832DRAFT_593144 [Gaertneriomyces semiglobifer]
MVNDRWLYDLILSNASQARELHLQQHIPAALQKLDEILSIIALLKERNVPIINTDGELPDANGSLADAGKAMSMVASPSVYSSTESADFDVDTYVVPAAGSDLWDEDRSSVSPRASPLVMEDVRQAPWSQSFASFADDADHTDNLVPIEQTMLSDLDQVFFIYLAKLCSDMDATDSNGEKIHQTLVAKKLSKRPRTDSSFFTFKFRIRSFTNAFRDELVAYGLGAAITDRQIKSYLWQQRCILRFNEEGKMAKSKGSYVWVVLGRKTPEDCWLFKEFTHRICGEEPPPTAYTGYHWQYELKVHDPQTKCTRATFHSPWLPSWLRLVNNVLIGRPAHDAQSTSIRICATFSTGNPPLEQTLEKNVQIIVSRAQPPDFVHAKPAQPMPSPTDATELHSPPLSRSYFQPWPGPETFAPQRDYPTSTTTWKR